jgi:S-adenosylmethionine synthetase
MELVLRRSDAAWVGLQPTEVVERKGLGHPDTICDAIAEEVSRRLCHHYLGRFGEVLHHNVDKVLLVGGSSHVWLGGGEVVAPMEIYLAGRATEEYRGERIPIHELAIDACDAWLRAHLRCLNVDRDVRIMSRLRPGSHSLAALFGRSSTAPLANDTSCGVGFAPLTETERLVLAVERHLNAADTKRRHPGIGEDIKVMAVRRGTHVALTVSAAIISRHVQSVDEYENVKRCVHELVQDEAGRVSSLDVSVVVNAADRMNRGEMYLTVTGTSADSGDDGEVGRGNRVNGLITPYRAMSMEAAAGKNPVTHLGKLYNLAANRIAASLLSHVDGVISADCLLVSTIGEPIFDPQLVDVRLAIGDSDVSTRREAIRDIVAGALRDMADVHTALGALNVSMF